MASPAPTLRSRPAIRQRRVPERFSIRSSCLGWRCSLPKNPPGATKKSRRRSLPPVSSAVSRKTARWPLMGLSSTSPRQATPRLLLTLHRASPSFIPWACALPTLACPELRSRLTEVRSPTLFTNKEIATYRRSILVLRSTAVRFTSALLMISLDRLRSLVLGAYYYRDFELVGVGPERLLQPDYGADHGVVDLGHFRLVLVVAHIDLYPHPAGPTAIKPLPFEGFPERAVYCLLGDC